MNANVERFVANFELVSRPTTEHLILERRPSLFAFRQMVYIYKHCIPYPCTFLYGKGEFALRIYYAPVFFYH